MHNRWLADLDDGAVLGRIDGPLVFTTDSFVVQPLEFPGGDIGRLAVAGTVNDLLMMGADPIALSLAFIIEEGLELCVFDRIVASIAATAEQAGVRIATGDTKVIERRAGDGLMINTSGVGRQRADADLSLDRIRPGDAIILTGTLADHGLTIMAMREGLSFQTTLTSDASPLNGLVDAVLSSGGDVKFLRDPTRSGLAGVLTDISESTRLSIEIWEQALPISPTATHAAEMLGLDPLTIANEGKCVIVASREGCQSHRRCLPTASAGKACCAHRSGDRRPSPPGRADHQHRRPANRAASLWRGAAAHLLRGGNGERTNTPHCTSQRSWTD